MNIFKFNEISNSKRITYLQIVISITLFLLTLFFFLGIIKGLENGYSDFRAGKWELFNNQTNWELYMPFIFILWGVSAWIGNFQMLWKEKDFTGPYLKIPAICSFISFVPFVSVLTILLNTYASFKIS